MEYEVRNFQAEDTGSVLDLMQLGLGGGPSGTRDEIFWRWKHYDNPFGRSIVLVATNGTGHIAGLRTFMQWHFRAGNRVVKAVRAVDTVTHPEHRRFGVFTTLTTKAVQQAKNSGVDVIFNTPNNSVLPGYLKLGWSHVSFVRPLVKVLNYPRFVSGIIRNRKRRQSSGQPPANQSYRYKLPLIADFLKRSEAVEELLRSNNQMRGERLSTDQSIDYLRWRYSEYPNAEYAVLYQEKNGALSSSAVIRANARFGLKEIVIDELFFSKPDDTLASSLLHELKRCVNADYIIAYFPRSSFARHALRKDGFLQVPTDGMNFTVNALSQNLPCNPAVLENWNLSLGDLEVF